VQDEHIHTDPSQCTQQHADVIVTCHYKKVILLLRAQPQMTTTGSGRCFLINHSSFGRATELERRTIGWRLFSVIQCAMIYSSSWDPGGNTEID